MGDEKQKSGLSGRLAVLVRLDEQLFELTMGYLSESALYPMDFLANGAVKRALALSSGFRSMIEAKNMVCAGALLRLQVDTALRVYAAYIVPAPHEFASAVLEGAKVSDLKDRDGNRMHDGYLVRRLADEEKCGWLPRVYRETSGYVHFSGKHIFSTFTSVDDEGHTIQMRISAADEHLPAEIYEEAVDAFIAATELLAKFLHGWAFTKKNPEVVQELRKRREGESPSA